MPTIDITIRWAGPSDATSGSTYRIERTLDNVNWSTLAAAQAATSPYASVSNTINGAVAYGATSIVLDDATAFGTSGYGYLNDEALVQWAGKSTNTLTGVTWHSGYGTYLDGCTLLQAHESYADTAVSITLHAALYRITHINSAGVESGPAYLWFFYPTAPASSRHCVVVVLVETDLGVEARSGISVECYLDDDDNFGLAGGEHLDAGQASTKTQITNAFGIAVFQCWRSSARDPAGVYVFRLDSGSTANVYTISVGSIPDRDWIMLEDLL